MSSPFSDPPPYECDNDNHEPYCQCPGRQLSADGRNHYGHGCAFDPATNPPITTTEETPPVPTIPLRPGPGHPDFGTPHEFGDDSVPSRPPETSTRARAAAILAEAAETVGAGGDRHTTYGSAIDNFTDIGKLWAVILPVVEGAEITAEQVALCMNLVKVARLKHSPNHHDSWVDAAGYLALGGDIAGTPGRYM